MPWPILRLDEQLQANVLSVNALSICRLNLDEHAQAQQIFSEMLVHYLIPSPYLHFDSFPRIIAYFIHRKKLVKHWNCHIMMLNLMHEKTKHENYTEYRRRFIRAGG